MIEGKKQKNLCHRPLQHFCCTQLATQQQRHARHSGNDTINSPSYYKSAWKSFIQTHLQYCQARKRHMWPCLHLEPYRPSQFQPMRTPNIIAPSCPLTLNALLLRCQTFCALLRQTQPRQNLDAQKQSPTPFDAFTANADFDFQGRLTIFRTLMFILGIHLSNCSV